MKSKLVLTTSATLSFALVTLVACAQQLGKQQIITSGYSGEAIAPSSTVAIPILYDTSDGATNLLGISLLTHFDSSQLTLAKSDVEGMYSLHSQGIQVRPEQPRDSDGDPNTDMVLITAWINNSGAAGTHRGWPTDCGYNPAISDGNCFAKVALPLLLYTINFQTTANFTGTTINFASRGGGAWRDNRNAPKHYVFNAPSITINAAH